MLNELQGIKVIGSPELGIIGVESEVAENIYYIVDEMKNKGWPIDAVLNPISAKITVTPSLTEDTVAASFLDDFDTSVIQLHNNPHLSETSASKAYFSLIRGTTDRWLVNELSKERVLAYYSMPSIESRRSLRTLSVEGRKMSLLAKEDRTRKNTIND